MARTFNNIFVRGLTGAVGDQFIIRQTRSGRTIIANKPSFDPNREFTEPQKAQQEAFRQATSYAKFAKNEPVYINKAKGTTSTAYNLAVADWFGAPEVLEIDASNWTGESGQPIRIQATDNILVTRVLVVIKDANDTVLEQGEAVPSQTDGRWWIYTTKTLVNMTAAPQVAATAFDLPGHDSVMVWSNN